MKKLLIPALVLSTLYPSVGQDKRLITAKNAAKAGTASMAAPKPVTQQRQAAKDLLPAPPIIPIADQAVKGSYQIGCTWNKTTHLLFPSVIKYVDLGSPNVIADKAEGIENILRLKADTTGYFETNLSVVTADGRFYSFLVSYQDNPTKLAINMANNREVESQYELQSGYAKNVESLAFLEESLNENDLSYYAQQVSRKKRILRHVGTQQYRMALALQGIYIKENVMFYQLKAENYSDIDYDIDFIRFYIRDKGIAKRTVSQERELVPYYVYHPQADQISRESFISRIYAFPKVTIPDDKVIEVEMYERAGGRHLTFVITNHNILTARSLEK